MDGEWYPGDGVEWDEIDWYDMDPQAQQQWMILGWDWDSWDDDSNVPPPPTERKLWFQLNDVQQDAAKILGFDEESWEVGIDIMDAINEFSPDSDDDDAPKTRGIKMPAKSGGLFACCMGKKAAKPAPVEEEEEEDDEEEEE